MDLTFVADLNHNNPIDIGKLAQASFNGIPCAAVILKATQGIGFTDNKYRERAALARAAGLEVGAYDFNMSDDVEADVQHFFEVAQPDARTSMWLDFERNPKSEMDIDRARQFLTLADAKLGRPCGIYGGDKLKECLPRPDPFFAKHPLWLCQYPSVADLLDAINRGAFKVPAPWIDVGAALIQFSGDGKGPQPHTLDGLENGADLSAFGGTPDQLRASWPGLVLQ